MGKRSRASRSVRVVVPDDDDDDRPFKTFRTRVMRTDAIAADKARADEKFLANMNG